MLGIPDILRFPVAACVRPWNIRTQESDFCKYSEIIEIMLLLGSLASAIMPALPPPLGKPAMEFLRVVVLENLSSTPCTTTMDVIPVLADCSSRAFAGPSLSYAFQTSIHLIL